MKPVDLETRQKYMELVATQGIDQTLTELHNDIGVLEPRVFEGGYNKDRFEHVQGLRLLARELWNMKLRQETEKAYGAKEAEKTFGKDFAKLG